MNDQSTFKRTTCACPECTKCCKRQPGSLAAGDFERIARHLQLPPEEAKKYFWASPGALVRDSSTGRVHRIGSVTPQLKRGRCVFLSDQDKCTIHAVAPFGCAMFDCHMSPAVAHPRSIALARSQLEPEYQALRDSLPYARSYRPNRY